MVAKKLTKTEREFRKAILKLGNDLWLFRAQRAVTIDEVLDSLVQAERAALKFGAHPGDLGTVMRSIGLDEIDFHSDFDELIGEGLRPLAERLGMMMRIFCPQDHSADFLFAKPSPKKARARRRPSRAAS